MIFFKIVCYFANCEKGKFDNLRILGSGGAIYHFDWFFLNTGYLQSLFSCNGKTFLGKKRKALRNILDLGAVAYFSSTLYISLLHDRNYWKFIYSANLHAIPCPSRKYWNFFHAFENMSDPVVTSCQNKTLKIWSFLNAKHYAKDNILHIIDAVQKGQLLILRAIVQRGEIRIRRLLWYL